MCNARTLRKLSPHSLTRSTLTCSLCKNWLPSSPAPTDAICPTITCKLTAANSLRTLSASELGQEHGEMQRPTQRAVITLTTDFGDRDWFVGTMKGVILGINPRASIVDITHGVTAGDMRGGAFALASSYRFFPKGTVHIAVIDPGVGSRRRGIVVQTSRYSFVGPDNGVLSWALAQEKIKTVHVLENAVFFHRPVSQTFHGRDIFGPVAAHLSLGLSARRLGRPTGQLVQLPSPQPRARQGRIDGEII